jgi:hypothetical protein
MVLVALLVRRPILPVHPTVKETVVLAPRASDASVDPDAVHLAAGRPAQCPAAVRDYLPSASVDAPVPKVASSFQELQRLDAPSKVVFPCLVQPLDPDVVWVARVPLTAGAPELQLEQNSPENLEPKAARQVPSAESESVRVCLREAHSAPVSQRVPQGQWARVPCSQAEQHSRERQVRQQPARPVLLPQALVLQLQGLARQPRVSRVQPQAQPGASEPLSPPHLWFLFPLWPLLLPRPPRPLLPEDARAPSPRHPQGSNLSASFFPLRRTRPAGQ